jgi:AraC-like DNA-binding protein
VKYRRRIDWLTLLGPGRPLPTVLSPRIPAPLGALFAAFDEVLALDDPDAMLRRAIEVAREHIGLQRAGIFLFDRPRGLMYGAWGSDIHGNLVDEHHLMYEPGDTEREAFRRAEEDHAPFTVFRNAPIIEHRGEETVVHGKGWVAYTPIRSSTTPIGMLFNDAGMSSAPVNPTKQSYAAMLCALLGTRLDPLRAGAGRGIGRADESPNRRLVADAVAILAQDPSMGGKELAAQLDVNPNRLTRAFREEMGMSVVEYRNRVRLDVFSQLSQDRRRNLLDAALAAGFGSYAQFHRVFTEAYGRAPRECLSQA